MEENRILKLKEKAKSILKNIELNTCCGDAKLITILQEIEQKDIKNDEIDLVERTIENIENYFYAKRKMQVEVNDYEYLKKIAEILRNQKIRIEDNVVCGQPIFKIILGEEEEYDFITREGARSFAETHSTMIEKPNDNKNSEDNKERRKSNSMKVTINKNLQFARIMDIIKRNY